MTDRVREASPDALATPAALNLELKARDPTPGRTLATARALGARDRGVSNQIDTFFVVPRGRLKLRESEDVAELIEYERKDLPGPRTSRYRRLQIAHPERYRDVLSAELGVLAVIEKRRHLMVKGNVRIHLDRVRDLGTYVELEAVVPPGHRATSELPKLNSLRRALAIADERLVAGSYLDELIPGRT
ncbi:MAG: class IV adenylate cyclase [Acidimicrobiaceae bacterium]|nr:class IV adenylate cyclase [Acidimicrobiaceae bacterium]